MRYRFILMTFALMWSMSSHSQFGYYSGNSWLIICEDKSLCERYTQGVIEGILIGYGMGSFHSSGGKITQAKPFCLGNSHTTAQHVAVIRNFYRDSPEYLSSAAMEGILVAMMAGFPCK
ncbi:Rap1a/Tai family immunity protein [Nitrosomonas sp. ANs5]|uniref:Rap1a/Tai family immunity protein n=1 Tax=Nitrosomonas sp. ANs5 TaxID=3423941 RepID=UPI003D3534C0